MRWKQFFTPVKLFNADEAKKFITHTPSEKFTILDVRQPLEYQTGHIAGAKLIPLGDLGDRLNEIDSDKPTIVYCAIGGRSRVAATVSTFRTVPWTKSAYMPSARTRFFFIT